MYLAQHAVTGRHAHLRVLNNDATAIARTRFVAELNLASRHPNSFLPWLSLRSDEDALVAVCEIPQENLKSHLANVDALFVARVCQQIAAALQIIHEAGWVHGALCCGAVELVDVERARVRLLDIGMGLELGRSYAGLDLPNLPRSTTLTSTASPQWDLYSLGVLGLHMTAEVECRSSQGCASDALIGLFSRCTADAPDDRPESLRVVWTCLHDIIRDYPSSDFQDRRQVSVPTTARLTPAEAQWFVEHSLNAEEAVSIEGYAPQSSPALRLVADLTSIAAIVMVALLVAALVAGVAFHP